MPKASVIIPTYNRERFIAEAISSVLKQTFTDFELIVVDDGSTDDTRNIVNRFSSDKIKYFYKPHSNAPDTRNYGLKKARGDFIVWLDSDDIIMPDAVSLEINEFTRDPSLDVVYGDHILIDEDGQEKEKIIHSNYSTKEELIGNLIWNNSIPNSGTMVRRRCYEEIGYFDPSFSRIHDYEFWSRAARKYKFKHIDAFVQKWRPHKNTLTERQRDKTLDSKVLKRILKRYSLQELFPWIDWEYQEQHISHAIAFLTIAKILSSQKAYDDSFKYFNLSLENFPIPEAYFKLANIFKEKGMIEEAKRNLQEALRLDPYYREAREALLSFNRLNQLAVKLMKFISSKRKTKIVFYIIDFSPKHGGAESQLVSLILNRKSTGYNPLVFSYSPISRDNQYVLRLKNAGIKIIAPWSIISFNHGFRFLLSLYDLFNRAGMVHSFCCSHGARLAVTWARRRNIPMIFSERDSLDYYQKRWFYSPQKIKEIGNYCVITVLSRRLRQKAWEIFGPIAKVAAIPDCIPESGNRDVWSKWDEIYKRILKL